MLLSHNHKFIFIRTQKSASTSLELFFGKYCDHPDDIVTTLTPSAYSEEIYEHNKKGLTHKTKGMRDHAEWHEIRKAFGNDIFQKYFKFCFVRNPWDKVVSYYWERAFDRKFDQWCFSAEDSKGENSQYYMMNDKDMMDYIGKVENLKEDVEIIMSQLNLSGKAELPYYRNGYRNRKIHYSYYYDSATKNRIRNLFNKQIKMFGYEFEEGQKPNDKIIVNTLDSISGYILSIIVKKITSLLINQEKPKVGYLNITYNWNPDRIAKKFPDYKIISLIPTLIQDYYDILLKKFKPFPFDINKIRLPEITNLHEISEADNILYIDSFHIQRNLKDIFRKISEFLDIPIINIEELADFYKTNDHNIRNMFVDFLTYKEPIISEVLSAETALKVYKNVKRKIKAYT